MTNGFKACGLRPFTAEALNQKEILQKQKNVDRCQSTPKANNSNKKKINAYLEFIEGIIGQNRLRAFKEANNKED